MAEPLIMINDYRIDPAQTHEFLRRFEEIVKVVEADEPRMLYFAEHLTADRAEGSTVQIHADAENLEYHLELLGGQIAELVSYLDFLGIRIYGTPTEPVLEQLRAIAGDGVVVKPLATGLDRFPHA